MSQAQIEQGSITNPKNNGADFGFQEFKDELEKYLDEKLGDQHQCLFHLDEHRKMCPRISEGDTGKDFSRGAMELLARVSRARVVATYTDVLVGLKGATIKGWG